MFQSMRMACGAAAATALFCLVSGPVHAQVSSINGARTFVREFNDDPTSNLTTVNNYPSLVSFNDQSVDRNGQTGGFANRHVWRFSNTGSGSGGSPFVFNNNSFFDVSMTLTLTSLGGSNSPRKEAGFLFDTVGGQGQFIVNSDAGEVVVFGGPLPFYSFNASNGLSYTAGTPITLGMKYFQDPADGFRKIIYTANGISSPAQVFTNLEQGIINGTTLGGYLQVVVNSSNPNNGATATFANINIQAIGPEPGSLLLLLCGVGSAVPLAARLRRRS